MQVRCSIEKYLSLEAGAMDDYRALARFHYRGERLGPVSGVWVLRDGQPVRRRFCPVVGVIVYTYPVPQVSARNVATGGFFNRPATNTERLSLLNQNVRCISRVIIEPRWRGLGLAGELVRRTLPMADAAMVESMAIMGRWTRFFENAGMICYSSPQSASVERLASAIETVGIERHLWADGELCQRRIEALDKPSREFVEGQIKIFCRTAGIEQAGDDAQSLENILGKLSDRWNYYIWLNPEKPVAGLGIDELRITMDD